VDAENVIILVQKTTRVFRLRYIARAISSKDQTLDDYTQPSQEFGTRVNFSCPNYVAEFSKTFLSLRIRK